MKNKEPSQVAIDEFYDKFNKENLNKNIDINIYKENNNLVELNEIWSETNIGQGYATKTLKLLINTCSAHGVDICLKVLPLRYSPSPYMDKNLYISNKNKMFLSKDVLQKWYEKNGFEVTNKEKLFMIKKAKNELHKKFL